MLLLLLLSLLLMTLDHRYHYLQGVRSSLATLLYPLQYLVSVPVQLGGWVDDTLSSRDQLLAENRALRGEQYRLQIRLQRFEALEVENRRLRALLQSLPRTPERMVIGELLAVDFDPLRRQVLINKGSRDDVFEGHPLIDAAGVVGQVIRVTPFNSTALLLTDPNHATPVQVNRTGMRAVALGTGAADLLELPHIPNNTDLTVGDLLVTSGLGQRFPTGYPVARIEQFEPQLSQPYARVTARTTADLEQIREVLLIWPNTNTTPTRSDNDGSGSGVETPP